MPSFASNCLGRTWTLGFAGLYRLRTVVMAVQFGSIVDGSMILGRCLRLLFAAGWMWAWRVGVKSHKRVQGVGFQRQLLKIGCSLSMPKEEPQLWSPLDRAS